jgi:hypothetical protein
MEFLEVIKPLTFRAKLALPLIYAEHVIFKFAFTEDQSTILNVGFDACWKWIKDQSISAHDIYETIAPILMLTTKPQDDERRLMLFQQSFRLFTMPLGKRILTILLT